MPFELNWLRPLWWLALLPLALLWWAQVRAGRQHRPWDALVDPHLRPSVLVNTAASHHRGAAWLVAPGAVLLIAALAGPAWQQVQRPVFRIERAQVLLLDLAASMNQADVPPTRLGRARFELLDLLAAFDEGHTALVAFGAEPFLVAPLTTDTVTLAEQVSALTTDTLPLPGASRPELALMQAEALLEQAGASAGTVILITDGQAGAAPALPAARRLLAAGHRLSVLAVVATADAQASARLGPWAALATAGGGDLVLARADEEDLRRLLLPIGAGSPRGAPDNANPPSRWRDDGPWLLLALLPLAALAGRRGWLGLLPVVTVGLCALAAPTPALADADGIGSRGAALVAGSDPAPPPPAASSPAAPSGGDDDASPAWIWSRLWQRADQQAFAALVAGDESAAGREFNDVRWRAAALYQAGRYADALLLLRDQPGAGAHYNRGNTLARLGRYQDAVAEYEEALALAPGHADAQHNRDLVLALIAAAASEAAATRSTPPAPSDTETAAAPNASAATDPNGGSDTTAIADPARRPAQRAGQTGRTPTTDDAGAAAVAEPVSVGLHDPDGTPAADQAAPPAATRPAAGPASDAPGKPPNTPIIDQQQLLQQVEDDPGGLLRERFMLQYLRRHGRPY